MYTNVNNDNNNNNKVSLILAFDIHVIVLCTIFLTFADARGENNELMK